MGYLNTYLARLDSWLKAENAIEVAINHDGTVWLEQAGDVFMKRASDAPLAASNVHDLAVQIANDQNVTLNEGKPLLSASVQFEDLTLRAQAVIPPATPSGTVLAFRIFCNAEGPEPKRFDALATGGVSYSDARMATMANVQAKAVEVLKGGGDVDAFLQAIVDERLNIVVSGGTSTGKTELGRRLLWMVDPDERIVTIEDSAELLPHQPNVVSLIADRREDSERSAAKLLQATLRLRPDRIIVGELRGSEVVTFLDAINTGHSGSFTTVHADSAAKALDRLAFMVLGTGTQLTYGDTIRYLQSSIDVIVQTGRKGDRRGIQEIYFPGLDIGEGRAVA